MALIDGDFNLAVGSVNKNGLLSYVDYTHTTNFKPIMFLVEIHS